MNFIRSKVSKIIAFAGLFILLLFIFGSPVSGKRSWAAFSQHYSQHYLGWHPEIRLTTDYSEEITKTSLGNANSIYEAFKNNSADVLRHMKLNARDYVFASIYVLLERPHLYPSIYDFSKYTRVIIILFGLGIILLFTIRMKAVINILKTNKSVLLFLIAIWIITMLSSVVIFAREHYIIVQDGLVLFIAALLLSELYTQKSEQKNTGLLKCISIAVVVLLITPNIVNGYKLIPTRNIMVTNANQNLQPNLKTINFIKELHIEKNTGILWLSPVNSSFIGDQFQIYHPYIKQNSFRNFIEEKNIGIITDPETLGEDYHLTNDSEYIEFLSNPADFGFLKLKIPQTSLSIFVKEKLQ